MTLWQRRWYEILDLARATAYSLTRDHAKADDIAAMTVERILRYEGDEEQGISDAFVVTTVRNLVIDDTRKATRHRQSAGPVEDADELSIVEPERAYVYLASLGLSPSAWHTQHERMRRQMELTSSMLASLDKVDRRLVVLSLQGVASAEIAEELGYASADVVRQKRHRIYARLRHDFGEYNSSSLFD